MKSHSSLGGVAKFLYNHNPFYVLSAGLILYGLYQAFRGGNAAVEHPWWLAAALCGYTTLMAVTAFLVIKLGRVWEDARSIVLILLLQFAAISLSFDQLCSTAPGQAAGLLAFGFGFSLLVSEALLGGLEIRLPRLFRLPYYLILGLFFGYPLLVKPQTMLDSIGPTAWRIYLFPVVVGLAFLTLLPAIRRGANYVSKNGTPWPWPWFPWIAFGFLAFAAGVRSYVLTYNFNLMGAGDAFGAYYLTPLLFSLLVLVTELAVVHQARRLQTALMIAAPLLVVCSVPLGDNYIYLRFLWMLTDSVGSPLWLAAAALAGFYAVAWLRKLPLAEGGLMAMLALLTMVGRGTIDRQTLEPFQWYPWCAIGAIQLGACLRHRSSFRAAVAAVCFVVTASIAWRDTSFVLLHGAIPLHLLVVLWLLIGLVFRDRFAVVLRRAGLALTVAAAVGTAATIDSSWFPPASRCAYLAALAVAAWAYWWATRDRWWFCAGLLHAGSLTAVGLWFSYQGLHSRFGPGALIPLSWGAACFLIAVLISALKGGLGTKLRQRLIRVGLMGP